MSRGRNLENRAHEALDALFGPRDDAVVDALLGEDLIQHNAEIADGRSGLKGSLRRRPPEQRAPIQPADAVGSGAGWRGDVDEAAHGVVVTP